MTLERPITFLQVVAKENREHNIIMEESYSTNVEEKHDRRSYVVKEELMVKVLLKTNGMFWQSDINIKLIHQLLILFNDKKRVSLP